MPLSTRKLKVRHARPTLPPLFTLSRKVQRDLGRSEFIGARGPSYEKDRWINGPRIVREFSLSLAETDWVS